MSQAALWQGSSVARQLCANYKMLILKTMLRHAVCGQCIKHGMRMDSKEHRRVLNVLPLYIFSVAPVGAYSRASMTSAVPSFVRTVMNPPPPMPLAMGLNTPSHSAVVTVASAALPPRFRMSTPVQTAHHTA